MLSKARTIRLVFAATLAALSASCATPPAPPVVEEETPGVRASIRDALVRADAKKAEMLDAAVPASLSGQVLTVIWEGEAAEILKRIASSQKLEFRHTGPSPRLPLPIFVKLRNVSLSEALQAIGEQCGQRADVVLTERTIELRAKLY